MDAVVEGVPRSGDLEGLLVEVVGPVVKYSGADQKALELSPAQPVEALGARGRAISRIGSVPSATCRYVVETFDGRRLMAPKDSLVVFEPPCAEEPGGFDVAWPYDPDSAKEFSIAVGKCIEEKGYCVAQLCMGDECLSEAAKIARALPGYTLFHQDVKEEYLGSDSSGSKATWLSKEPPRGTIVREDCQETQGGLRLCDFNDSGDMRIDGLDSLVQCDRLMSIMGSLLWPVTPRFEDEEDRFVAWGRTNCMVRADITQGDAESLTASRMSNSDQQSHNDFVEKRKLGMLLMVEGQDVELELRPQTDADVTLSAARNRLVLFRHDKMQYSFKCPGSYVALQSWVLDIPTEIKEQEEADRLIDGPPEPLGRRVNVMSIHTRYPGQGHSLDAFWNMLIAGGDTMVQIPLARWDLDIYYRPEHTIGFSMTKHGALLSQDEIECFDNEFFGIEVEEAQMMTPYQRVILEVGYECLYRGGHTRESINGWNCGVFVGDSGSDWDELCPNTMSPHRFYGRSNAISCQRLSHIFNLKGPCSTAETACSSSLVAVSMAHLAMRMQEPDQKLANISTNLYQSLVVGINTLIGPGSYISLSGPGMLTTRGRCFTFNDSADGFARGEGCGALSLKVCNDSIDSMGRLAMLIGSAINQDGRSASMTAPHGPSQQDVIRNSMREAGVAANLITIAECHGTGTALGDPIEVGALRGVMGTSRQVPILKTSAKANIGHLEAGAGTAGLIKCIQMLRHCAAAPNCHLKSLNPHLDVTGYPVYFETELVDFGQNSGLSGVSSFGFGGTNARADVWGHAERGSRKCISGTVLKERALML